MIKHIQLILIFSLLIISCKNNDSNISNTAKPKPRWDRISLKMAGQSIDIYSDRDSITNYTWDLIDSVLPSQILRIPINEKREKIYLEPEVKDTLFAIVMDMITKPVIIDRNVSCYAGNIRICIQIDNTELCCKYSSVGEWTNISPATNKLYDILKNKTEISTQ